MKSFEEYKKILKEKYAQSNDQEVEERYLHSLGVSKKAVELIDTFHLDVDKEKAKITGILHDYAKFESMDKYQEIVKKYRLDESLLKLPFKILHSVLGPYIIQDELNINDQEILDAIRYHTTGSLNMSKLAEVIFLADFTDETRINESFCHEAMRLSKINFREAILEKIKRRLAYAPDDEFSKKLYYKYKED